MGALACPAGRERSASLPKERPSMSIQEKAIVARTTQLIEAPGAALAGSAAFSDELALAFEEMRPKMEALPKRELGRVTGNVPRVVIIALGAAQHIEPFRAEIGRKLPEHDHEAFDDLRKCALALLYTHLLTMPSAEIETRLQAVLAEAVRVRAQMLAVAEAYVTLGLFDAERVAFIRSGSGHVDLVQDVLALAQLFLSHRVELEGKTPFSPDDLARAKALGLELLNLLGRRKVGNEALRPADANEAMRVRAFRLLLKVYDTARWAVSYVRWREGDVDELMPSLFGGRPRRRGATGPKVPAEPSGPAAPRATGAE